MKNKYTIIHNALSDGAGGIIDALRENGYHIVSDVGLQEEDSSTMGGAKELKARMTVDDEVLDVRQLVNRMFLSEEKAADIERWTKDQMKQMLSREVMTRLWPDED